MSAGVWSSVYNCIPFLIRWYGAEPVADDMTPFTAALCCYSLMGNQKRRQYSFCTCHLVISLPLQRLQWGPTWSSCHCLVNYTFKPFKLYKLVIPSDVMGGRQETNQWIQQHVTACDDALLTGTAMMYLFTCSFDHMAGPFLKKKWLLKQPRKLLVFFRDVLEIGKLAKFATSQFHSRSSASLQTYWHHELQLFYGKSWLKKINTGLTGPSLVQTDTCLGFFN